MGVKLLWDCLEKLPVRGGYGLMIFPVIMAGGTGTRFWPQSRSRFPKQFLKFNHTEESLLQSTYRRIKALVPEDQIYVVTNKRYLSKVNAQLPSLAAANVIVEPMRRDTAPCIGLATLFLSEVQSDGVMVLVPSDHYIAQEADFMASLRYAVEVAEKSDSIITLGITPTEPKTGYGYIKQGEIYDNQANDLRIHQVEEFTEKPNLDKAREYLASGQYLWNSGIYICRIKVMLRAIYQHMPKLARSLARIGRSIGTAELELELRKCYREMEKISIDYGIMEKEPNILVIPCECGWDDIGSWSVVGNMLPKDQNGNSIRGNHIGIDTENCIIEGSGHRLIATLGVENLIVIQTKDVVMVCQRERDQEVKELVKLVKSPELRRFW